MPSLFGARRRHTRPGVRLAVFFAVSTKALDHLSQAFRHVNRQGSPVTQSVWPPQSDCQLNGVQCYIGTESSASLRRAIRSWSSTIRAQVARSGPLPRPVPQPAAPSGGRSGCHAAPKHAAGRLHFAGLCIAYHKLSLLCVIARSATAIALANPMSLRWSEQKPNQEGFRWTEARAEPGGGAPMEQR